MWRLNPDMFQITNIYFFIRTQAEKNKQRTCYIEQIFTSSLELILYKECIWCQRKTSGLDTYSVKSFMARFFQGNRGKPNRGSSVI